MPLSETLGLALTLTCAGAVWGCADGRTTLSPTSPSSLSRPWVSKADARPAVRYFDSDGDGYDDGSEPGGMPERGSGTTNPEQVPLPDQAPVPVPVTINIIGPAGAGAFVPNPLQVALGNMIVWANSDLITHGIVLDDGTPVGRLLPGQSSIPIALATETMGYHCTLHPTMVGQITMVPAGSRCLLHRKGHRRQRALMMTGMPATTTYFLSGSVNTYSA